MILSKRQVLGIALIWLSLFGMAATAAGQVTRDTTIYTATRIRSTVAGKILSISTTKLDGLPRDTIRLGTPVGVQHDTVVVYRDSACTYVQSRYESVFTSADSADVFVGLGAEYLGRIVQVGNVFRVSVYTNYAPGASTLGDLPTRAAAIAALRSMWRP